MDKFFEIEDGIRKLHTHIIKNKAHALRTRKAKVKTLKELIHELKSIVLEARKTTNEIPLRKRYVVLKNLSRDCIKILHEKPLDVTSLEENQGKIEIEEEEEEIVDEEEELEEESEQELDEETSGESSEGEFEDQTENMPPKLDLNTALKLVDKYGGEAEKLTGFFESMDLLKDYSDGVDDGDVIKFLKTRLIGPAHGAINNATTLTDVKTILKAKFSIRFSPQAIEAEMANLRQTKKSITDFGQNINELAAKLAAAHVSNGTFLDEAAADAIVQPIAVKCFTNGIKDPQTQFFLRARNPTTLTKAISDALEVTKKEDETVMWLNAAPIKQLGYNFNRGYRSNRGYRGNRGFRGNGRGFRGNNVPSRYRNNYQYDYQQPQQPQYNNSYRGNQSNRGQYRHNLNANNRSHTANMVEQVPLEPRPPIISQQTREEANLIDLFR